MPDPQAPSNVRDSSQLKKSLEELANTTNPFTLFFKIWWLFGVINDEIVEIVETINEDTEGTEKKEEKTGIGGILYDYGDALDDMDPTRIKTRKEWEGYTLKNWILLKYPNIFNKKTSELERFQYIIDYYSEKGYSALKDLKADKNEQGELKYELKNYTQKKSSPAKIEEYKKKILKLEAIIEKQFKKPANGEEDVNFKKRKSFEEDRNYLQYVEYTSCKGDAVLSEKLIEKWINEDRKAKDLRISIATFKQKCREVDWKEAILSKFSNSKIRQTIISITNSILSPIFLPIIVNSLAKKIGRRLTIGQINKYTYIISNIFVNSYDEYLSINKFFFQLTVAMDIRGNFFKNLSRYGFWIVFWGLSIVFTPIVFSGILTVVFVGFFISELECVRRAFLHMNIGFWAISVFLLIACTVFWTLTTKGDFFSIQYDKYRTAINQATLKNFPEALGSAFRFDNSFLKSSAWEWSQSGSKFTIITASGTITDENFYEMCYNMNYIAENKSCFDYYKGRSLDKKPVLEKPILAKSLNSGEKVCLKKLSDSLESLGIRGTIWWKTEKVFDLYHTNCLRDRKNITRKRNQIIDQATRAYVYSQEDELRGMVKNLGFNPDNFRSNPMELARRLPSDIDVKMSLLSEMVIGGMDMENGKSGK